MDEFNKLYKGLGILQQYSPRGVSATDDEVSVDTIMVVSDEHEMQLYELDWDKSGARSWSFVLDL